MEKVTSYPPVRADATSEIFGRASDYCYWVKRDALGTGAGMTILLK